MAHTHTHTHTHTCTHTHMATPVEPCNVSLQKLEPHTINQSNHTISNRLYMHGKKQLDYLNDQLYIHTMHCTLRSEFLLFYCNKLN